ncbi:lactococcin 972 family bacteriocin [Staphylococcus aureus]
MVKHYDWSLIVHNKRNHGSTAVGKYSSFSGVARPGVQSKARPLQRLGVETKHL